MAQSGLSLDDLRLVRAIGAAGSLTGAARRLRIDHSTAFRRLGAIEARTAPGSSSAPVAATHRPRQARRR